MPQHQLTYVKQEVRPGLNVQLSLGVKQTKGDVGIEIEVEGNKFPKPPGHSETHKPVRMPDSEYWSYVKDGSLRGDDNAEYVLTAPILFDKVPDALREIYKTMEEYGSELDVSNRTSVHVHLNCQEFHLDRLTTFMCAWFTLEEILTEWCGEHRVGNMFCLRAIDAPAIVNQIRKFVKTDGGHPLGEILHYAGLNPASLMKYGSLEVRTLRGCTEPETIIKWVSILKRLYDLSGEYNDPRRLVSRFSQYGPMAFFDLLLGDCAQTVREGVTLEHDHIKSAMMRGIRFAQDLCYCRDWDNYKPTHVKADPFGRDINRIAQQLLATTGTGEAAVPTNPFDPFAMVLNQIQNEDGYDPEEEYDHDPDQDYPDPDIDVSW